MSRPKRKTKKTPRICKCGRIIKQKYYRLCVKCRQARRRRKKQNRDLRRSLSELMEHNDKLLQKQLG